jgi:hypothetical protein
MGKEPSRVAYMNRVATVLRHEVPPAFRVKVRTAVLPQDVFGDCQLVKAKNPYFVIRVQDDISNGLLLMVLVHEWAHTLAWTMEHQYCIKDHDAEWGVAYARCWRAVSVPD